RSEPGGVDGAQRRIFESQLALRAIHPTPLAFALLRRATLPLQGRVEARLFASAPILTRRVDALAPSRTEAWNEGRYGGWQNVSISRKIGQRRRRRNAGRAAPHGRAPWDNRATTRPRVTATASGRLASPNCRRSRCTPTRATSSPMRRARR